MNRFFKYPFFFSLNIPQLGIALLPLCRISINTYRFIEYNYIYITYGFKTTGGLHRASASIKVLSALNGWSLCTTWIPDIKNGVVSAIIV